MQSVFRWTGAGIGLLVGFCAFSSVRADQVIISEVMYHPPAGLPEYLELWNQTENPIDFADWKVEGLGYTFPTYSDASPTNAFIRPKERILLSAVPEAALRTAYPSIPATVRVFSGYTGDLANTGEHLVVKDRNGALVCELDFDDQRPWPESADGAGHSLAVVNPDREIDDYQNWRSSYDALGTPGAAPAATPGPFDGKLKLSEVGYSPANTVLWVEVHNTTETALSVGGIFLAYGSDLTNRFSLTGTIAGGGFTAFNFAEPISNSDLFLIDSSDRVLDNLKTGSRIGFTFEQKFPLDSDEWYADNSHTINAPNNPARNTDIVINEIMADPLSDQEYMQYVELYNRGASAVDLSGWEFAEGIRYSFPSSSTLNPGEYLVVAKDPAWITATYGGAIQVQGPFDRSLSNDGELIRLEDINGNLADEVHYRFEGDWPEKARGLGSSLELLHPDMDNGRSSAWADSDESAKSSSASYSFTSLYQQIDNRGGESDYNELHMHLVGDSHIEIDNLQMRLNGSGANLISNGGVMSTDGTGNTGWLAQGTHHASYASGGTLHLISNGHGDNRPNRAEIDVIAMAANNNYEVSFDARWVFGKSRLIVQSWDHTLGDSIEVTVPNNLGTPGTANSVLAANPPPQVDGLLHQPAVPNVNEPVVVTAQVFSDDPLSTVRVWFRLDSITGDGVWQFRNMLDNGNGDDARAGDGEYTATLTSYVANNNIVQFYVEATTANGETSLIPRPGEDLPAMWMVDSRVVVNDLRTMRFVISAFDRDRLKTDGGNSDPDPKYNYKFPRLSNNPFNVTIIANETDIRYNGGIRKSGSPWTRAGGNALDRGKWQLPRDRMWRNKRKYNFDNDAAGGNREKNRLIRYWLYLMGHPSNESEIVRHYLNADGPRLQEEIEPNSNALLQRNFDQGTRGELYRIDDQWWFSDDWSRGARSADWRYKGTGETLRYHSEWIKRTRENEYDYAAFIDFVQTLTANTFTEERINLHLDPELITIMAAIRGYLGDWDSLTLNRGKNGYFYRKPDDGRFMFLHWDSDLGFQGGHIADQFIGNLPEVRTYLFKPYIKRRFNHYLTQLHEDYTLNSTRVATFLALEDQIDSYTANVPLFEGWFRDREVHLLSELGGFYTEPFVITSGNGTSDTTTNVFGSLAGGAPSSVHSIEIPGVPGEVVNWSDADSWSVTGIPLTEGANALTVNGVDFEGNVVFSQLFTLNKIGNVPPTIALDVSPASWNVSADGELAVDARNSTDPEGQVIDIQFAITGPAPVTTVLSGNGGKATFTFIEPGLYDVTVTVTDLDGEVSVFTREASVYGVTGFSSFNASPLDSWWAADNLERRDNFSPGTSFSFDELPGFVSVQVLDEVALPLAYSAYTFPWLHRSLPTSANWSLQSKVVLDTRKSGAFHAGVLVEMLDGTAAQRFAFGLRDGVALEVIEIDAAEQISILSTSPILTDQIILRTRREGNALHFEFLAEEAWVTAHTENMAAGVAAVSGGFFATTDAAQSARFAVDYLMLVDMSATVNLYENLRVSEIMYDPVGGSDYEYLELLNAGVSNLNLNGLSFVDGNPFAPFAFPNINLGAGQRLLVVRNLAAFSSRYPSVPGSQIAGEWVTGKLDNAGEIITIVDANTNVVLSVEYDSGGDWPGRAGGGGSSLEVIDPLGELTDADNWRSSSEYLGTPGTAGAGPRSDVRINEVLSHTDPPNVDTIELYNTTTSPINIGGWYLSDSGTYKKYRIADNTMINGLSYLSFDETDFNPNGDWNPSPGVPSTNEFAFGSKGDDAWLTEADASGNIISFVDHEDFDAAANGVSFGHYTNSIGEAFFTPQIMRSFDATNAGPRVGPVVITEIMYHPAAFKAEFIELQNITNTTVNLFHDTILTNTWKLSGVGYSFPTNLSLAPSEIILVSAIDPLVLRSMYNVPPDVRIFGPWSGILKDDGERIVLQRPDNPDPGETFAPDIAVDTVRYQSTLPWPTSPHGLGFSLERLDPTAFGTDPANWRGTSAVGGTPGETTLPLTSPRIRFGTFEYNIEVNEFSNPTHRLLLVSNSGIGTLNYTLSSSQPWLLIDPTAGSSTGINDVRTHQLILDTDNLDGGDYVATITATDPAAINSPLSIPVYLSVNEPLIGSDPESLVVRAHQGVNHPDVAIDVFNADQRGTILNYSLSTDVLWMDVNPSAGTSTDPADNQGHDLAFEHAGIPLGTYSGAVNVFNVSAPNSPYSIPVDLEIVKIAGEVHAVTNRGVGKVTFEGSVTNTVNGADVFFYYGREDGGSDPNAWDEMIYAGFFPDGEADLLVSNLLYGINYKYRLFVDAGTDSAWSPTAEQFVTLSPSGNDFTRGLHVRTFNNISGLSFPQKQALLADPDALLNDPASGTHFFTDPALDYNNAAALRAAYDSLTVNDHIVIAWHGFMIIGEADVGLWSFGTASDDGSVWHIDLNLDGDYTDTGEFVVNNNFNQGRTERMGQATFPGPGCYPIVIGFYEHGGGENMEAKFKKGNVTVYGNLDFLDGSASSTQNIALSCPPPALSIENGLAENVFYTAADLGVDLEAIGTYVDLYVHYGPTNGGTNEQNWTYNKYVGSLSGVSMTNLSFGVERLVPGLNYWTYEMRNDVGSIWDVSPHLVIGSNPPYRPVIDSIARSGNDLVVQSSGQSGWDIEVEYTTDNLELNENVTWLPCTVIGNNFANGVNFTTVERPPLPENMRFYLRVTNFLNN